MNKRKLIHLIGVSILIFSAVLLSVSNFSKDRIGAVEENLIPKDVETEKISVQFTFLEKQIQGKTNETLKIKLESDQPTRKVTVQLPLYATIQDGFNGTVSSGEHEGEWVFQQEVEATFFDLPISFYEKGEYTVVVISEDKTETETTVIINEEEGASIEKEGNTKVDNILSDLELREEVSNEIDKKNEVVLSETTEDFLIEEVSNETELRAAINNTLVENIKLTQSITVAATLLNLVTDKNIDLNENQLTMNGNAQFRLSGGLVKNLTIKNGYISGTATTFIGDGADGAPTSATRQLDGLKVTLENISVEGNNFYNAFLTDVIIVGDVDIKVLNTGFRVKNFTATSNSNLSLISSGGNSNGLLAQNNGRMQGVTMGQNSNTNGISKIFTVEEGAKATIEVDQGGQYNNAIADFSDLEVFGELRVDTFGTPLRSTSSYQSILSHTKVNINPGSKFFARARNNINTGVFFSYPMIFTVDDPLEFDMIYYGNGQFMWPWAQGSIRSHVTFKNMNLATWVNSSAGIGSPQQRDYINFINIENLINNNAGTVTTDSEVFGNGNFVLNNYSRISNDIYVPSLLPELQEMEGEIYGIPHTAMQINGIAKYRDMDNELVEKNVSNGAIQLTIGGKSFTTTSNEDGKWELPIQLNDIAIGTEGTLLIRDETDRVDEISIVVYDDTIYPVAPMDPLNPEAEVDPENKPDIPEEQGLLSIDFVSQFNFGRQNISVQDKIYYANPQRLLNEDGTVNEQEERPNYVQISDRRPENDRGGWQLSVTQTEQFTNTNGHELAGASLSFINQQIATVQGGSEPKLQETNSLTLLPGMKSILLKAQDNEGTGTWIYRFGNDETLGESVSLNVPKGSNPEATSYKTTLIWELSAVPEN